MSNKPNSKYNLDKLEGDTIQELGNEALGELIRDLVHSMIPHAHLAMLEGAFEMADEDAVAALREAAWKSVGQPDPGPADARNLIDAKDDAELQEILAAAIHQAGLREDPAIFEPLRQLGEDSCTFLAMEIEDWQNRYELEEGVAF